MLKRHDDELTARLEQIFYVGVAYLRWNELYRWYGVSKIAAATMRDLDDRCQRLGDEFMELPIYAREIGEKLKSGFHRIETTDGLHIFAADSVHELTASFKAAQPTTER